MPRRRHTYMYFPVHSFIVTKKFLIQKFHEINSLILLFLLHCFPIQAQKSAENQSQGWQGINRYSSSTYLSLVCRKVASGQRTTHFDSCQ